MWIRKIKKNISWTSNLELNVFFSWTPVSRQPWQTSALSVLTWSMMESRVLSSRKPRPLTKYSPSATMWLSSSSSSRASALWATALHSWCTSVRNSLASVLLAPLMSELQKERQDIVSPWHRIRHTSVEKQGRCDGTLKLSFIGGETNMLSFPVSIWNTRLLAGKEMEICNPIQSFPALSRKYWVGVGMLGAPSYELINSLVLSQTTATSKRVI